MKMIPQKLRPGDTIGIVAPSDPVRPEFDDRLKAGVELFNSMGFKVRLGQNIHSESLGYTATAQEKAADINAMFADPAVNAIICAQGGDSANAPLDLLDWDLIEHNPKIFLGLSDITVLLNAIFAKTGLVTFHGNDILWGFGNDPTSYEIDEFRRFLIDGKIGAVPPNRPRKTIRSGHTEGILLGGNIRCLLKLAGTPYWPDFSGGILFIEAYIISPSGCQTAFHQLKQMGVFDRINGIIVGYIDSMQKDGGKGPFMEEVLQEVTTDFEFPILKINDFGHNCPNTLLPVGGEARMDADAKTLEITQPVVHD
jgi:muramoyltetrapeptide carboxypeptidase